MNNNYFDNSGYADKVSGGAALIPINTPKGTFNVWTKRVGNNPTMKVLLLHGGPGMNHEYLHAFDSYFPQASIQYYYYDQLGSSYSDQPDEPELWEIDRFVDEVEQVRVALNLSADNFYLYGHSWGGILAIEYALKYQGNIKGLIISNMMSSIAAYNDYAENVLMPSMDQQALAEIKALEAAEDHHNPRYQELLLEHYYVDHILRIPLENWPDPINRTLAHINNDIYVPMQGPSELGSSGTLVTWNRSNDIKQINVPTLIIGAQHDSMDPKHMQWMADEIERSCFLLCPEGGHFCMLDDAETYFSGLIQFIKDIDNSLIAN